MYCENCGKEISDGDAFCTECGAKFGGNTAQGIPGKKKKSHKSIWITLGILIAAVVVFFVVALLVPEEEREYLSGVKNGYLGTYTKVTISEVLEFYEPDGTWSEGEAQKHDGYLVEYGTKDDDFRIQFYYNGDDDTLFLVTQMNLDGENTTDQKDMKLFINQIYDEYVSRHSDCGFQADFSSTPLLGNTTKKGAWEMYEDYN